MKAILISLFLSLLANAVCSQTYAIKADKMISGDKILNNPVVIVHNDKIIDIKLNGQIPDSCKLIDLTGYTILPGLIDVHTHLLINDEKDDDYEKNLYQNSAAFRAIRATAHLTMALNNGFTTLRDVCTEGAGFTDVDLRNAVELNIIKGPRIIPSTKGIATTGQYYPLPRRQNWDLHLPSGIISVQRI